MVTLTRRGGGSTSSMATLSRFSAAFLIGLLGATNAQALPNPLLGPDGAFWAGTLHPESPDLLQANRDWVIVDPRNGDLILESTDFRLKNGAPLDVTRTYKAGSWQFSFEEEVKNATESTLDLQWKGDQISSIRARILLIWSPFHWRSSVDSVAFLTSSSKENCQLPAL